MTKSEEKKNILIVNLTRMGDLLQITPLIVSLKDKYPLAKITLLVNKVFSDTCKGFPFIDKIHVLDIPRFKKEITDQEISLVKNYRNLEKEIENLKSQRFDMIFNPALSKTSVLLTYLLECPNIVGFTMDGYGHRIIRNPWINYFANKLFNREYNLFNLVDIILRSAGLNNTPKKLFYHISGKEKKYCREFLKKNNIQQNDFIIGLQPGASRRIRQWPPLYFSKLGNILIKKYNAKLLLFGTPKEIELGQEIEKEIKEENIINLIGKTSIDELAALLARCDYLITGDTGTMHLATAVGTRVIALFFGSAYCFETGPYGEGHVVLQSNLPCVPCYQNIECKNPLCQKTIRPFDVITGIEFSKRIRVGRTISIDEEEFNGKINIFYSQFDEKKFLEFVPLIKRRLTKKDIYKYCYKEIWQRALNKELTTPIDFNKLSEKIILYFKINDNDLFKSLKKDLDSFERLIKLSSEGKKLSIALIELASSELHNNLTFIKDIGKKIERIDQDIIDLGNINTFIKPLTLMFNFGKENLTEKEILPLSRRTLGLYDALNKESLLMAELIKNISLRISDNRVEVTKKILRKVV